MTGEPNEPYVFSSQKNNFTFQLSSEDESKIGTLMLTAPPSAYYWNDDYFVQTKAIRLNKASFDVKTGQAYFLVSVIAEKTEIRLYCDCDIEENTICQHQLLVIQMIKKNMDLQLFFDQEKRLKKLREIAKSYGLENETNLDDYFNISFTNNRLFIKPKHPGLIEVSDETLENLEQVISQGQPNFIHQSPDQENKVIVIRQHKYYKHLVVELYEVNWTQQGKIKNPINLLDPITFIWQANEPDELKFFAGFTQLQKLEFSDLSTTVIQSFKAIIKNPFAFPFYLHLAEISENITANSVTPVQVKILTAQVVIVVKNMGNIYQLFIKIITKDSSYYLDQLQLRLQYFLVIEQDYYLVNNLSVLKLIHLLKKKSDTLLIHQANFPEFKKKFLDKIEENIRIEYQYVKQATKKQRKDSGYHADTEKIIYLSNFGNYILIQPVLRYAEVEISVRSQKQLYGSDTKGKEFLIGRNHQLEGDFLADILKQHADFTEQMENNLPYFYLHKKNFLDPTWFLDAFESWRKNKISILGFNEIEGNQLNPNKVSIRIQVNSGLNWFNVETSVKFGKSKASLKSIKSAIKNKNKYVKLDDGTLGILPEKWLSKFAEYFEAGEINAEDILTIPKNNFTQIDRLFSRKMIAPQVLEEIEQFRQKLEQFSSEREISLPHGLKGNLRQYQKIGLKWLNLLDDFNFGGCLADDMGLGKSVQVLAFLLLQRDKVEQNTNLLVVPTSLLFNWQLEIKKFAPTLKTLVLHGSRRKITTDILNQHEIILISYSTLLIDITFLRRYAFNYVILDESQHIKNPDSQRYKAVCLLQSRNKLTLTGTPMENNTFDLYSQFSFACPGLFKGKRHFQRLYSIPIDRFKNKRRARELQDKIKPFLLRRTKQQVATELPEKTEVTLYCEMSVNQRKVYNDYEQQIRDYLTISSPDEIKKNPIFVLKGLTKLRQICNDVRLLQSKDEAQNSESAKMDMLMEQLEVIGTGQKVLVFSQFVTMLDLIKKELEHRKLGHVMLTGSTTNREEVVQKFQQDANTNVFLISLKAGGTGLNLTEANYVFLVDPWWNPAVEDQAIDRVYRIGQEKKVFAVRLICPDTVEEKILQLQSTKKELTNSLIEENNSFFQSLTKDDLLNLLS